MIATAAGLARWRWLLPLVWALALGWAWITDLRLVEGRFLNAAVQGVQVVMFIAPVVTLAGVLAGAALRHNHAMASTAVRSLMVLTIRVSAVHTVIGGTALAVSALTIGLRANVIGADGWSLIVLGCLTVAASSIAGQALGRLLPEVLAAPLGLLGNYVVLAFPRSLSNPLWLRHLAFVDSCCSSPQQVSPRVTAAIAIVAAALITAGLLTAVRRGRALAVLVAAALVWAGGVGATSLVSHLNWSPASPRTGDLECSASQGAQVCVWPENADALPALVNVWADMNKTADDHRLDLPTDLTERVDGGQMLGDGHFSFALEVPEDAIPDVLASAGLPSIEPCTDAQGGMDSRLDNAWLTLARWWISASGHEYTDDLVLPHFDDLLDVPDSELDRRLALLIESLRTCDPTLVP